MLRVFVCSPYRGDVEANVARAERMCRKAITEGRAPYAPHLYLPRILDDSDQKQRAAGISAGIAFMLLCDEVWVPKGVTPTEGMTYEMKRARWAKIPIVEVEA